MKRKKELLQEIKMLEKELKSLASIVSDESVIPTEDEIHGWSIRMNACISRLEILKEEILEFYRS
ncbi:MAG: hypothetical protein Q8936_04765 [Bacillota bacterium]|nr:hypothetical protein [Bacillota bacterium]